MDTTIIRYARDLRKPLGVSKVSDIGEAIYDSTSCGAWFELLKNGIKMGSIVEGTEMCTRIEILTYPFTMEQFNDAIFNIESEALDIWNLTHGCPDCFADNPGHREWYRQEYGNSWGEDSMDVDIDCKTCHGQGIIK